MRVVKEEDELKLVHRNVKKKLTYEELDEPVVETTEQETGSRQQVRHSIR